MGQPAPQVQPAPQAKAEVATVGQAPSSGDDHAPAINIGFDVAIGLCLGLALIAVRRIVLNPFDSGEQGVERDDAA
jgi:hypothetical protein